MRNLKRALSLALASVMLLGMMVVGTSAASFPDVDNSNNVEAIEVLKAVGAMKGDGNGSFNPTGTFTRNELAAIGARLLLGEDAETYVGTCPFTDVPEWAVPYVAACYDNGLVQGVSETEMLYGGDGTVTAQEVAVMMLRALGYENITDTGADWAKRAVAQANKIGLFKNVGSNPTATLTRDQVAQLALNTLEATCVDAEVERDIVVEGVVTIPGKTTYTDVESDEEYAGAIAGTPVKGTTKATVQLGEKLYKGDLKKSDDADEGDFGRPGDHKWTWKTTTDIYNEVKSASVTFVANTSEDDVLKAIKGYVFGDKDTKEDKVADKDSVSGADLTYVSKGNKVAKTIAALTANGKQVEIFADSDKVVEKIVVITYTVSEVESITTNNDGDVLYKLKDVGTKRIYADPDTDDTIVLYGDVAEDDIVTVATDGKVAHVYPTTSFTGVQESWKVTTEGKAGTITVDGETYNVGLGVTGVLLTGETNKFPNSDDEATFYVDINNFVVKSDVEAAASEYAIIDSIVLEEGKLGAKNTVTAILVFTDGSSETVNVSKINGVKVEKVTKDDDTPGITIVKNGDDTITLSTSSTKNEEKLKGAIVDYTVSGKNYELTLRDAPEEGSYTSQAKETASAVGSAVTVLEKGKPQVAGYNDGSKPSGRSDTIYVIKTGDEEWKTYTGFANVPSVKVEQGSGKAIVSYTEKDDKVVLVYIDASGDGVKVGDTESGRILYVSDTKITNKGTGSNKYYELTGIVDGEEKITVKSKTKSVLELDKGTLCELTEDEDGYVTETNALTDGDFEKATLAANAGGNTMGKWTYDDDTLFIAISTDHKVVGSAASDAEKGDAVYVKVKGDKDALSKKADDILAEVVYIIKSGIEGEVIVGSPADKDALDEALAAANGEPVNLVPEDDATPVTMPNKAEIGAEDKVVVKGDATAGTGEDAMTVEGEYTVEGEFTGDATVEEDGKMTVDSLGTKANVALNGGTLEITGTSEYDQSKVTGTGTLIVNGEVIKKTAQLALMSLTRPDEDTILAITGGVDYTKVTVEALDTEEGAPKQIAANTTKPFVKGSGKIVPFSADYTMDYLAKRTGGDKVAFYAIELPEDCAGKMMESKVYYKTDKNTNGIFKSGTTEKVDEDATILITVSDNVEYIVWTFTEAPAEGEDAPTTQADETKTVTIYFNGNKPAAKEEPKT